MRGKTNLSKAINLGISKVCSSIFQLFSRKPRFYTKTNNKKDARSQPLRIQNDAASELMKPESCG